MSYQKNYKNNKNECEIERERERERVDCMFISNGEFRFHLIKCSSICIQFIRLCNLFSKVYNLKRIHFSIKSLSSTFI